MKISRDWLQTYFDAPLPDVEVLSHALTFHAFEIDGIENDVLDVKVTPNRGHDCLSYRGIAKEVSAILDIPLKADPFSSVEARLPQEGITVTIADPQLCPRYIGCVIRGVRVGPSPEWIVKRLAQQGQHSINNIVDAANYIMFDLGQPLHAFDAGLRTHKDGSYAIAVRSARPHEHIIALDEKSYELAESMLVIADGHTDVPLGIAGVKGGKESGISATTTDVILEAANFNGPSLRRTARALKFRTDAVQRFEQVMSPEVAAHGMRAFIELVLQIAGGEVVGYCDAYPQKPEAKTVRVRLSKANAVLGTALSARDTEDVFRRLGFDAASEGDSYAVRVPSERLDLEIEEDLIEEIGRIVGYDKVPELELGAPARPATVNANYAATEKKRTELQALGYSEVFTSVFSEKGERVVANKVDGVRPYMRATLVEGLKDAYERNAHHKDLLGLSEVRLFEIGIVWKGGVEVMMLGAADKTGVKEVSLEVATAPEAYETLPSTDAVRYEPYSKYPTIVRDIALWVPTGTSADDVLAVIRSHAGELLVRSAKFDEFAKGDRVSYAFRLVFQSMDRTLFDHDAEERMVSITKGVTEHGWEVR